MLDTFLITLETMVVMFLYMAAGYILRKSGKVNIHLSEGLSGLLVNLLIPCMSFNSFSSNIRPENISRYGLILLVSFVILMGLFLLASQTSRLFTRDSYERNIFWYSFTISNTGYMGYPVVTALYGEQMLFNYMLFCLPWSMLIFTWGINALKPQKQKFSWKQLLNPATVAMLLGILVGLLQIPVPKVLTTMLSGAGSCVGPCAMVMTGFLLAGKPFLQQLRSPRMVIASAIRLLVLPLLVGGILVLCHADHTLLTVAVVAAGLPLGLNTVVFPEAYGGDSSLGVQGAIISNLMGLVTIPLILSLLTLF